MYNSNFDITAFQLRQICVNSLFLFLGHFSNIVHWVCPIYFDITAIRLRKETHAVIVGEFHQEEALAQKVALDNLYELKSPSKCASYTVILY